MIIAPLPINESERLAALRKYDILDSEPEGAFNSVVQLASYICQTPIAAISLVDEKRQWFKAIAGLEAKETSRDVAFCAHAILQDEPLVVPDALQDQRFSDNPLVAGPPDIRFYAGVPLVTSQGHHLGTLCVIDRIPRTLGEAQLDAIKVLADNVMAHLDLRLSHKQIRQYVDDLQLAATIFDSSSESMVVTDAENRIITVNPAFTATTGYTIGEVVGRNPAMLKSGKHRSEFYQEMWTTLNTIGHWSGEVWNVRKNKELYAEWLSINVIFNDDGSKRMHVAIFSDITDKKRADELIWKQANFDHLTKLPNRRLFRDRLDQCIKTAHRNHELFAILYLDLDHFKEVNDKFGHDIGDLLLIEAADRISHCVREMDTVARMGGDEFTVILAQIIDPAYAGRIAANIISKLSEPFDLGRVMANISASVGVAIYPYDGEDSGSIIKNSDISMYRSKSSGRCQFTYFKDCSGC